MFATLWIQRATNLIRRDLRFRWRDLSHCEAGFKAKATQSGTEVTILGANLHRSLQLDCVVDRPIDGATTHSFASFFHANRHKLLFAVKPGGMAEYLVALHNTASYVDTKAKTDVYVGFLPSHLLERLLEKRLIVPLTLAKQLIALLSPISNRCCT
ncbi:hypothetical protein C8F01DRAFT_1108367 [Mycena amicta]|nr:hypothetical protein C8F01DRAFT_1108367 [Mycena amicta]